MNTFVNVHRYMYQCKNIYCTLGFLPVSGISVLLVVMLVAIIVDADVAGKTQ